MPLYLVSFKNSNDIYIGKTNLDNTYERLRRHKENFCCVGCSYVSYNLNNGWSNVYKDVIDTADMNEDLTYLLKKSFKYYYMP